jgi:hypothetical protein
VDGDCACGRPLPSSELLDPLFLADTGRKVGLNGWVGVSLGLAGGLNIFTPQGLLENQIKYVYLVQLNNCELHAICISYSCHLGSRFLLMLGVFGALIVWPVSSLLMLGFWKGELERAELGELSLFNGAVLRNIFGEFKMVL